MFNQSTKKLAMSININLASPSASMDETSNPNSNRLVLKKKDKSLFQSVVEVKEKERDTKSHRTRKEKITPQQLKSNRNLNMLNVNLFSDNNNNTNDAYCTSNENNPGKKSSNVPSPSRNAARRRSTLQVRPSESPFSSTIRAMKLLLQVGIDEPVYFLSREVLNDEELYEKDKFNLDKLMKINSFSKAVEGFEEKMKMMKVLLAGKKTEDVMINTSLENMDNNTLIKEASERRIDIYQNFISSIKDNFDQIMLITTKVKPLRNQMRRRSSLQPTYRISENSLNRGNIFSMPKIEETTLHPDEETTVPIPEREYSSTSIGEENKNLITIPESSIRCVDIGGFNESGMRKVNKEDTTKNMLTVQLEEVSRGFIARLERRRQIYFERECMRLEDANTLFYRARSYLNNTPKIRKYHEEDEIT